MITITKKDIGKRIEFRALCRWNSTKTIRVIKDVRSDNSIMVRFGGYDTFHVHPHEVIRLIEKGGE